MRVGIIGGGTIARLVLEHVRAGDLGEASLIGLLGRTKSARRLQKASSCGAFGSART